MRLHPITFIIFFLLVLAPVPEWVLTLYWVVMCVFCWIPFEILVILSFNRDASKFIWKSSEFWIKIIYGAAYAILQVIHYIQVGKTLRADEGEFSIFIGYVGYSLMLVLNPLMFVIVGGMDAIPRMTYKWKALLMIMLALINAFYALQFQLLAPISDDYVIYIQATQSQISFHSLLANVSGMLCVFLCKQAIDVIRNKDRCVSISYRPYLRWARTRNGSFLRCGSILPLDSVHPVDDEMFT